jgi:hypothetical protein
MILLRALRRKRWYRFSLRRFVVALALVNVAFGYVGAVVRNYRVEQETIAALDPSRRTVIDRAVRPGTKEWIISFL